MISLAYSVFDTKALQYNLPFFCPTDGAAVRLFSDLVNDTNTSVGRHPADYVLYCIGHYDDGLGGLMPVSPLRHVIDAVALVKVQPSLPFNETKLKMDPEEFQRALNGEAK